MHTEEVTNYIFKKHSIEKSKEKQKQRRLIINCADFQYLNQQVSIFTFVSSIFKVVISLSLLLNCMSVITIRPSSIFYTGRTKVFLENAHIYPGNERLSRPFVITSVVVKLLFRMPLIYELHLELVSLGIQCLILSCLRIQSLKCNPNYELRK